VLIYVIFEVHWLLALALFLPQRSVTLEGVTVSLLLGPQVDCVTLPDGDFERGRTSK
jgi:hypothetical protein